MSACRLLAIPLVAITLAVSCLNAGAATSCWISNSPSEFAAVYSATANVRVGATVAVTCQTTSGTQNVTYTITPNHGLNASGTQNRAKFNGSYVNYDFYSGTGCTTLWSGTTNTMTARVSGRTVNTTISQCVKPTAPAPTAAYHTDVESFTLSVATPGVTITGSNPWVFPVSIGVPTSCQISSPPGDIDFGTYVAFAGPKTTSTSVTLRCTANNLGITADIGTSAGGVVPGTGLNYSLAINATNSGGSNPYSSTSGTNGTRTLYINATLPGNQAGTCPTGSCSGSDPRTLTITY